MYVIKKVTQKLLKSFETGYKKLVRLSDLIQLNQRVNDDQFEGLPFHNQNSFYFCFDF